MSGPEIQPILDSAQQAASSGDYARAEALLREVARLQAQSLGPKHPDLASTFNNLGVVCERANKLMDAGQFYREALSIASASLNADDPLVVTSRDNLSEFHRGLGLVDTEAPQNVDGGTPIDEHPPAHATTEPAHDRSIVTTIPTSSELPRQGIVTGIAIGVALLGALAIWFTREPAKQPAADETRLVEERLSAFGDPLLRATPSVEAHDRGPSRPPVSAAIAERPAPVTETVDAQVLEASLCQRLSTSGGRWECTPTSDPAAGGALYFYTRIAAPTSIRIHHRWYRNGTLRQDVGLLVHPNPSAGYRTYSQRRVEAGDWRIVVMGAAGQVLREERIEVQ